MNKHKLITSITDDNRRATVGRLWCSLMHNSPMWPIHGEYECRVCGQRFAVPWADAKPRSADPDPYGGAVRARDARAA